MKLVIEDDAGTRTIVPFTTEELTLGRAVEGVTWRLTDRNVSRRHARFSRQGPAVFLEDLGSLTGTWLNGERLSARRRVRPGDLVEIGDYDLVVAPEGHEAVGPGTPPPLPAVSVIHQVEPISATALEPSAAGSMAPAATPAAAAGAPRLRQAMLLGAAALAGGLLAGLLLGRLSR
jgi:pSer/pThr/pTyr-binding forkhead associated (FHA) protein